jgi:hypothetical protein
VVDNVAKFTFVSLFFRVMGQTRVCSLRMCSRSMGAQVSPPLSALAQESIACLSEDGIGSTNMPLGCSPPPLPSSITP